MTPKKIRKRTKQALREAEPSEPTPKPIMELFEVLGRRWQLRVLWEMCGAEPMRFRTLQEDTGVSPSVLNTRLAEAVEAGIVELTEEGYVLTKEGHSLMMAMAPLAVWAERWMKRQKR